MKVELKETEGSHKRRAKWLREVKLNLAQLVHGSLKEDNQAESIGAASFDPEQCAELLLLDALRGNASDIHLDPESDGTRIRMRIDGVIHDTVLLSSDQGARLIRCFKSKGGLNPVAPFKPEEASVRQKVDDRELDLRLASVPTIFGEKLSIRLHDPDRVRLGLSDLGLSRNNLDETARWLDEINGMCLIAGPTGSGKTTTVYSMLHELNQRDKCIITIEDPIEYQINGITQIQVDPRHELTFQTGLRAMLRLDPDYLVLGEMRDTTSCEVAARASALGHVLLSTLHARDAAGVVTALRNWKVDEHIIGSNLELVIAQRLVRRLCQNCRKKTAVPAADKRWLKAFHYPAPRTTWTASGCAQCHETGYQGRIGVFEIWRRNENDMDAILCGISEHELRRALRQRGCRSFIEDGLEKANAGIASLSDIRALGQRLVFERATVMTKPGVRRSREKTAPKTHNSSPRQPKPVTRPSHDSKRGTQKSTSS